MSELKTFKVESCSKWSYKTKIHYGTCIVDGENIVMRFTIKIVKAEAVPDVLAIEEFCRKMGEEKATLEGYTAKLAAFVAGNRFQAMREVTGKGKTRTHGVITCTITS